MPHSKKEKSDRSVEQIRECLRAEYQRDHPHAKVDVKRQNNVSIRVRVVDPDFDGMDRVDRDTALWRILDQLPEKVVSDVTLLLLLTPDEVPTSLANLEFENPIPSRL